MSVADLRAYLERNGATLRIASGRLGISAPRGLLTPALKAEIRRHERALLSHLRAFPCVGCGRDSVVIPMKCKSCRGRPLSASGERSSA